jgi:hypothetical protein
MRYKKSNLNTVCGCTIYGVGFRDGIVEPLVLRPFAVILFFWSGSGFACGLHASSKCDLHQETDGV